MKRFALATLILALLLPFEFQAQKGSHGSGSRSSSRSSSAKSSTKSSSSGKTVQAKEHVRKDGAVVKTHDRSAPGTKSSSKYPAVTERRAKTRADRTNGSSSLSSGVPNKSTVAVRDSHGRIKRSAATRKEFIKDTGYPKGRKGYVVDHIVPLECGGADSPSNMQWQTVQEAKIKDRTERNCRR